MKILFTGFIVCVLCHNFCCAQQIKSDSVYQILKGKWYEEKDPKSKLIFYKKSIREYYKGVKGISTLSYIITNNCCDSSLISTKGIGLYLKETDRKGIVYCYVIMSISENSLELVYSGGRFLALRRESVSK